MVGLLRVSSLHLLPVTAPRPPYGNILVSGRDYRLGVQLVPKKLMVLLGVVPLVRDADLDGFDGVSPPHDRFEITVVVGRSPPHLDRRDDLRAELRPDGELDEASGPRLHLHRSLLSFCFTCFLIDDRISRLILTA